MSSALRIIVVVLSFISLTSCVFSNKPGLETISVTTRDGILLATDLYLPAVDESSYPTILIRTPYGKSLLKDFGEYYSQNGYVVAIQDVRGKYNSSGEWVPYLNEGKDGYDAIEWLAQQEWSNGKIGMVGGSYSGSVQLAAALESPPHLVTIIPNITPATPFNNTPYENGVFALGWAIRWTDIVVDNISGQEMNIKYRGVFERNWYDELNHLPVIELDKKILGKRVNFWRDWVANESIEGTYFKSQDYLTTIDRINIPVFLQSGWFDVATRGTKLIHKSLIEGGNKNVKLIIGPWVHSDRSSTQLGPMYLGEEAGIDLFAVYLSWFDYWLKGEKNEIMKEPKVQLFNIGPNKWEFSDTYPLLSTRKTRFYLIGYNADKEIEGSLQQERMSNSDTTINFTYDPSNPTPSFQAFLKKSRTAEYKPYIEGRKDVIVFESEVLDDPLTIAGPLSIKLYASSSAVDTDFNVIVMAVDSANKIFPIGQTFGILRAMYRDIANPKLLESGKVYEYNIDLSHTFYTLNPGEKLRVEISSCSFPEFARNLNTGKGNLKSSEYVIAEQSIYMSDSYPSYLEIYTK